MVRLSLLSLLLLFAGTASAQSSPRPREAGGAASSLVTSPRAPTAPAGRKDLNATWSAALGGMRSEDALSNQQTQAVFSLTLNARYDLTPFLNLRVVPRAYSKNGHIQSDSATTGKSSGFDILEASTTLHDDEWIELSFGALNGSGYLSGLLVDEDLAFPALRAGLQAGTRDGSYAGLFAEAAVPTSSSLTTNSRDYERTPSFTAGGLRARWKERGFSVGSRLAFFEYKNLPTGVATDSAVLGNTPALIDQTPFNEFAHEYRGLEGGANLRWEPTRSLGFEVGADGARNEAAPSGLNQAYVARGQVDLWTGPVKWSPRAEYFRVEPDAVVAYYNDWAYQANRVGYSGGLEIQYKRLFRTRFSGGERDVLFENTTQSRERFIAFSLETLDAVL